MCSWKLHFLGLTSPHSSSSFVHVQERTISNSVAFQTLTHKRTQACSFAKRGQFHLHRAHQVISCKKRIMRPVEHFEHAHPLRWTKKSSIHVQVQREFNWCSTSEAHTEAQSQPSSLHYKAESQLPTVLTPARIPQGSKNESTLWAKVHKWLVWWYASI